MLPTLKINNGPLTGFGSREEGLHPSKLCCHGVEFSVPSCRKRNCPKPGRHRVFFRYGLPAWVCVKRLGLGHKMHFFGHLCSAPRQFGPKYCWPCRKIPVIIFMLETLTTAPTNRGGYACHDSRDSLGVNDQGPHDCGDLYSTQSKIGDQESTWNGCPSGETRAKPRRFYRWRSKTDPWEKGVGVVIQDKCFKAKVFKGWHLRRQMWEWRASLGLCKPSWRRRCPRSWAFSQMA